MKANGFDSPYNVEDYMPTVFDNFSANVVLDGSMVNLGLWDTAGQGDYNTLRPLSYRRADIFILAFSLISKASCENISKKWNPELRHYAPGVPVVLVGTKIGAKEDFTPINKKQQKCLRFQYMKLDVVLFFFFVMSLNSIFHYVVRGIQKQCNLNFWYIYLVQVWMY